MTEILIPLADVPRHLKQTYGVRVSYRRIYALVLDGEVDAAKDPVSKRWLVQDTEIARLAELFGDDAKPTSELGA